jgi:hypothetical protein
VPHPPLLPLPYQEEFSYLDPSSTFPLQPHTLHIHLSAYTHNFFKKLREVNGALFFSFLPKLT